MFNTWTIDRRVVKTQFNRFKHFASVPGWSACNALLLLVVVLSVCTTGGAYAVAIDDADYLHDGVPGTGLVELGRNLFFDPILSGNRNISCASCHDPALGTSDALSLGLGEGALGTGLERGSTNAFAERIPRNAPALWNVGARANDTLFHDGRIGPDRSGKIPGGIESPVGKLLPQGLDSTLAAQALFPPLSPVEMAGQPSENAVARAVAADMPDLAWDILADRLRTISGYVERFVDVFSDIEQPAQIKISHAANALAAFQTVAFRADQSRFDEFLRTGSAWLFTEAEQRGMELFYNDAGCARCHSGTLLTDHQFHAIAMPQIGPGKGHGTDSSFEDRTGYADRLEDEGRYAVTGDVADLFRFRTPSLRNITQTAPYGHDGAYKTLEAVVRHHLDPVGALNNYTPVNLSGDTDTGSITASCDTTVDTKKEAALHKRDAWVHCNTDLRQRIAAANELMPVDINDQEVRQILAFLGTLTDERTERFRNLAPSSVPSGLKPGPAH